MSLAFPPRIAALLVALAAAWPLLATSAPAARLDFVSGNVVARGADGARRELAKGSEILTGDLVATNNGHAQLRFTDGARVSLKPGSEFLVQDYRFNGSPDGAERGFFVLLKGGMRTITGWIGRQDREKYRVRTLTATIGIRGTEYSVTYGNSINVNSAEGIVEVCNPAGCLLLYPGDEGYVADEKTEPVLVQTGQERLKKDDPPPPLDDFYAPANTRDGDGSISAIGKTGTPPQDRMVFGLVDNGVNITDDTINPPILISGTADGSASISSGQGLLSFAATDDDYLPDPALTLENGSVAGVMTWGQWIADTSLGNQALRTPSTSTFGDAILHYVVGKPTAEDAAALPGATYSLLGGSVSVGDRIAGASGALTAGAMDVSFSTLKINSLRLDFNVASRNTNYEIAASNLPIATARGLTFSGNGAVQSGPSVPLPCAACSAATINGAFFGAGASHAGVSFSFRDPSLPAGIAGAAAFSRNPATPP